MQSSARRSRHDTEAVAKAIGCEHIIVRPTKEDFEAVKKSGVITKELVSGLYNVVPEKATLVDNYRTYSTDISQVYNGIDLNVTARMRNLQLQAGSTTGQRVTDYCTAIATQMSLPVDDLRRLQTPIYPLEQQTGLL